MNIPRFVCPSPDSWASSVKFSSIVQSCPALCDPLDCSTPGFPVHHQLPEFTQTHAHWVGEAIQPSHPSPPAFSLSQHQSLFKWVNSSHLVVKYWSFSFIISPSKEYSGLISFFFFFPVLFIFLLYNIVLVCHTLTWIHHGCTCVLHPETPSHVPPHPIPLGHPSAPALSTLSHALNLDWWFVSHMILYMFQCHSPISPCPCPLLQSPKDCSIYLCLICCLAYKVIVTIFLDSIYMCQYTALVFFFLAYFTLYNRLQLHPPH